LYLVLGMIFLNIQVLNIPPLSTNINKTGNGRIT
jgi:hypothetical protein